MKMRASVLMEPGRIEVHDIDSPEVSKGALLVRVKAALTCGTDLKAFMRGHPMIPMPGVFGHEFSGIVERTGKEVEEFREGDEVMSVHSAPCLECRYCRKKAFNLCEKIMSTKVLGAFAEYILLPAHIVKQNVFHKPKSLTHEEAAFLEPLSCVMHGIESVGIRAEDTALVIGAGPIGLLHLLLLKQKGVQVAIMDINEQRLEIAESAGADLCLSPGKVREGIAEFTDRIGVDVVFECTGMPEVWEKSLYYSRKGGTVVLFGGCKAGTRVTYDTDLLHYHEITLRGVFHYTPSNVHDAYKMLSGGRFDVKKLISGRYSLEQVEHAFIALSRGKGIKYVIIP